MRTVPSRASVLILIAALACGGGTDPAPIESAESDPAAAQAAPPAPPPRRTLPAAEPTSPGSLDLGGLERIDLATELSNGTVTIELNDGRAQLGVQALVDGDLGSMAITDQTNPLEATITFNRPLSLAAARIYPVASVYDWVLEPLPGEGRLLLSTVPERTWSQIDLDAAVETSVVRIELLRLERDNFAHLGEIELYTRAAQ